MLAEADKPLHGHVHELELYPEVNEQGVCERRTCLMSTTVCPECGGTVDLWADTDGWVEMHPGHWAHDSYGPAMGACCGGFAADWFEGCFWYDGHEGKVRVDE